MAIFYQVKMENRSISSGHKQVENRAHKCKCIFIWANRESICTERDFLKTIQTSDL